MRKIYILLLLASTLVMGAQTTVNYPQRVANYDATFTDGGGNFNEGTDSFGMWANSDAKQSVAFRNFTETGVPGGTATTMGVGDSFTITVSATRAFGVIGLALLSSPSSTTSWADRINNYAVQVNLNGDGGNYDPWEVVSAGGTINVSTIGGSTTTADFDFKFTLSTATTMSVSINNGAVVFNVTLNNQNITGYSIYIADDWNGSANSNIYWKPTTEYVYAPTLNAEKFDTAKGLYIFPNPVTNTFKLNKVVERVEIYNLTGKLVKTFEERLKKGHDFDISSLAQSIYLVQTENENKEKQTLKLVKL
ncbi:T9SS type A sorting domain-containing protein [Flavobacteriaceae bacterium]|nr:T9SS type A sorting domain-containing protein [Flavobacteriaceae bacterium]